MSMLMNLPVGISNEFLGSWLNLKALVRLDSALCWKTLREQFLESLSSPYCIYVYEINMLTTRAVDWYLRRQLKLSNLELLSSTERKPIATYLRSFEKSVRSIKCTSSTSLNAFDLVAIYVRNLTSLSYCDCAIRENLSEMIWFNPQLRELRLSRLKNLKALYVEKLKLVHLRLLSLVESECDDSLLRGILCQSKHLTHLDLGRSTGITEEGLIVVAELCPSLVCVGLQGMYMGDATLTLLTTKCALISHIQLTDNPLVTDQGILQIAQNLSCLMSVNIGNNLQLSDQCVTHIANHCAHSFEILHLARFRSMRTSVVVELLQECTNLYTLNTSLQLHKSIVPHMHRLRTLVLWSVVTDELLEALAQHCKHLQVLSIAQKLEADDVTTRSMALGADLLHVATPSTTGTYRSVSRPVPYSEKGLLAVARGLPRLRTLNVRADIIDNASLKIAMQFWQAMRPMLEITRDDGVSFNYCFLK